jgi:MFS family permease
VSEALSAEHEAAPVTPRNANAVHNSIYSRKFWLVFGATFAANAALSVLVLFPLFIVRLHGSAATIGAVIGTGSLAALLTRPAASAAIATRGRRWTALWFLVMNAFAMALYVPLHSIWTIYAVTALNGFANGTARVALFAMIYEILPEGRQGEAMATFSLSGQMPALFAPLLGEAILKRWGFGAFFCSSAALFMVGAAMVAMMPDDRARRRQAATPRTAAPQLEASYRALLFDPALLTFWIVTLLFGMAITSRVSFIAPFAYAQGIRNVGSYFTIYAVFAVIVRASGRTMDRVGVERTLAPSLALLGIGLGLLALTGHGGILYLAAALGGLGHGFAYPALSALVIKQTRAGAMARVSTIYTSVWDLSSMAGPYLFGVTAQNLGYGPMFIMAGGLSLTAAIYFVAAQPRIVRQRIA